METVAIHATAANGRGINFVPLSPFGALSEMIENDGIYGAYRGRDGCVVVVDQQGVEHQTPIRISPDGCLSE